VVWTFQIAKSQYEYLQNVLFCPRFTTLVTEDWFRLYAFVCCLNSVLLWSLNGDPESKLFADYSLSDSLSHFAAEGDKVRIKYSTIRRSLTSSSLEARSLVNALFGLIIFYLASLVHCPLSHHACPLYSCEIITEIFHEWLEFLNKTNLQNIPTLPYYTLCFFFSFIFA